MRSPQLFEDPDHNFLLNNNSKLWKTYASVYLSLLSLLLIFSVITMKKITNGSKSKFGSKIATAIIVFSLSSCLMMFPFHFLRKKVRETPPQMTAFKWSMTILTELLGAVSMIAATYAIWSFGFYYFRVGYKLDYLVKQIPQPANLNKCFNQIFNYGMALNVFFPTSYAAINIV